MIRAYVSRARSIARSIDNCGIFIVFLAFFFLCSYILSMFVRAEIQSVSVFVRSEIQFATLLHRAIMMLQLFELTSRGFAVLYRFRHAGHSAD